MSGPRASALALPALLAAAPAALAQAPAVVANALGLAAVDVVDVDLVGAPGAPASAFLRLDGIERLVVLEPASVRDPEHFRVVEQRADGALVAVAAPAPRTYRGEVPGLAGASVAASWLDDGLHARILLPGGDSLWVEPLAARFPGAGPAAHAVYRGSAVLADAGRRCGVEDAPPSGPQGVAGAGGAGALALGSVKVAQVAVDADHEYYLSKGSSTTNVTNQIESIFNTMNLQYEEDVQIVHTLTTVIVRTDANDPYTTTSAGGLLDQLQDHWNAQQGSVVRDVVHMFTGVNLSGSTIGIAYLSVVCKKSSGYGLVQSDCCGSFASKTDLSAHELGHNWSAGHCDCVGWTMNPWITSANQFHPTFSVPQIVNYANAQSCLDAGVGSSPCDVTQYGVGLGGANVGTLASTSAPSIGSTFTFSFDGFGGFSAGALVIAAQSASLPFAGGTLLVALPSQLVALPVQSFFGAGGALLTIPDDPGLVGLTVHGQVGLLAPAQPGGLAFSNGLSLLICD